MSWDIFGGLVGKAKRRELEGRVRLNLASLGKRVAVGAVAAAIAASARPDLLGTKGGLLHLAGVGLVAMIPAGAAPAGLVTPAQPGAASALEAAVQRAVTLISAPGDRKAAAQALADLAKTQAAADLKAQGAALRAQAQAELEAGIAAGIRAAAPELVSLAVEAVHRTNMEGLSASDLGTATAGLAAPARPVSAAQAAWDGLAPLTAIIDGTKAIPDGRAAIDATGGSQ